MKSGDVHHIKCVFEEEAPLYESYIYLSGNRSSIENWIKEESGDEFPEVNRQSIIEMVKNFFYLKGRKLMSIVPMLECSFDLDYATARIDDLPCLKYNFVDNNLVTAGK